MMSEHLATWYSECVASYLPTGPRRWTQVNKRKAIELILRSHAHRSNRAIAKDTGFSRELIAKERRRLVEGGKVAAGPRIGRDGKRYRMQGS